MSKPSVCSSSSKSLGEVTDLIDSTTFVVTLRGDDAEAKLRPGEFVQVNLEDVNGRVLVGQVDLIVGRQVEIGATTRSTIGTSGLFLTVVHGDSDSTSSMRATVRCLAIVEDGCAASYAPTTDHLSKPVYVAEQTMLKATFSIMYSQDPGVRGGKRSTLPTIEVGYLRGVASEVNVVVDPAGFMRHTCVFGQSGSGKSFSFPIVLEELLRKTDARIVVLDPNADYASFSQLRPFKDIKESSRRPYTPEAHAALEEEWFRLKTSMLQFGRRGDAGPATLLFSDVGDAQRCALLRIDPIEDPTEFGQYRKVISDLGLRYSMSQFENAVKASGYAALRRRIQSTGVADLSIWCEETSLIDTVGSRNWRFASFDVRDVKPVERSLLAAAILKGLYDDLTTSPRVTFFVMEEAHNFCPAHVWYEHQKWPRDIIHEMATEGRKYGAFLMMLTQNPSRLSPQALLQCDNVILMRMTSSSEVEALATVVRDAGPRLAEAAYGLKKGEAICLGGIVRAETPVKFDLRKTRPGGDDISKDWTKRRNL